MEKATPESGKDGVGVVQLENDAAAETLHNSETETRFHKEGEVMSSSSSSSSSNTTSASSPSSSRDPLEYDYHFEKGIESNIEDELALEKGANENSVLNLDDDEDNNDGDSGGRAARCLHVPAAGTGSQIIRSYFFNVESEECERFYYSGEGGNDNRFSSLDDCLATCVS